VFSLIYLKERGELPYSLPFARVCYISSLKHHKNRWRFNPSFELPYEFARESDERVRVARDFHFNFPTERRSGLEPQNLQNHRVVGGFNPFETY